MHRFIFVAPLLALGLASCGYTPLYGPNLQSTTLTQQVQIGPVTNSKIARNVAERRTAQLVAQRLQLAFPSSGSALDTATVTLTEDTSALSIRSTATVQRAQINLAAQLIVTSPEGIELLNTNLSTAAAYNVENTPYGTESGKTAARLTAARNLAEEITRRLALFYRTKTPTEAPTEAN